MPGPCLVEMPKHRWWDARRSCAAAPQKVGELDGRPGDGLVGCEDGIKEAVQRAIGWPATSNVQPSEYVLKVVQVVQRHLCVK